MQKTLPIIAVIIALLALGAGATFFLFQEDENPDQAKETNTSNSNTEQDTDNNEDSSSSISSSYSGAYELIDSEFGTEVIVTIDGNTRTMTTNALPNHETGEFPNSGNPNSITAQDNTYTFTLDPVWTGSAVWAKEPGIGINGIKFEPETAELVECSSGESYKIEAFQDEQDLGFDFNNAHVQPDETYHYHGVPEALIDLLNVNDDDLVHVGFAIDGYLMYYSKSSKYSTSYQLSTDARSGSNCAYRGQTINISNSTPNGTYVSDWEYIEGLGDLDECNGTEINGEYAYVITEQYPYISRCLNGEFTQSTPGGGAGGNAGGPPSRR